MSDKVNKVAGVLTPEQAKTFFPPEEHEYYSEQDIAEIVRCSELAQSGAYPTKQLNTFVLQEVERTLKQVATVDVAWDEGTTQTVYVSKIQKDDE